jgi:hypothetical protein
MALNSVCVIISKLGPFCESQTNSLLLLIRFFWLTFTFLLDIHVKMYRQLLCGNFLVIADNYSTNKANFLIFR